MHGRAADGRARDPGRQAPRQAEAPWRTTRTDPAGRYAPDLVERDFTAEAPNRLWVTDFTYLRTWEGVAFFAGVAYFVSKNPIALGLALLLVGALILRFPTIGRVQRWIDQQQEKLILERQSAT